VTLIPFASAFARGPEPTTDERLARVEQGIRALLAAVAAIHARLEAALPATADVATAWLAEQRTKAVAR
jgi:hypothetical protein